MSEVYEEVIRIVAPKNKYHDLDEIIENELNKIYNNKSYLCENYLDDNISIFIAMFLGYFNLNYKDSTMYFPYNHKEYMINAAVCRMIDTCRRISQRIE